MIRVNRSLCTGCGLCVDECSAGAISLFDGAALIAPALCNDCGACVDVCPAGALESVLEPAPLAVVETPVEVIPAETRTTPGWLRTALPATGAALAWVGREVAPRLARLALNAYNSASSQRPRTGGVTANATGQSRGGRGRQGRRRRRRGRRK
jgi:NAD-dependent dihydropyrimidine dehydrogenase PreA subunit